MVQPPNCVTGILAKAYIPLREKRQVTAQRGWWKKAVFVPREAV
jgi:hypothetical protein